MIKIKKIIFIILLSFTFIEKGNAEINDSLFMTIGNKPILKSDIVNEIKIILILNNESYSDDKRDRLHEIAVSSTTKRNIKEIELERNNFWRFNKVDFNKELNKLAADIFVDVDTLRNICASNELDFSIIEKQVQIELAWNGLIYELYKNRLTINPEQIEEQLKVMQSSKKVEEYLMSEIIINKIGEDELENKIKELENRIEIEGFENVAKDLSISESSIKGGDLGWINENIVSDQVKSVLINTPVGKLSNPIRLPDGILFFKIREKREIDSDITLEEMKNRLVNNEKTKILQMHSKSHYDKVRRSISIKFYQ